MTGLPPVRYAKAADGVNIAYRVVGDGPMDVVWVPGLMSHLDLDWENALLRRVFQHIASFARLIVFDKRGMGLSDRNVGAPSIEKRMDDVRAVMDAAGSDKAALIGVSEGGPMSLVFAATYPERTVALVLYGTSARFCRDTDYPYGNEDAQAAIFGLLDDGWGSGETVRYFAQSHVDDPHVRDYFAKLERAAGSPGTMRPFMDSLVGIDVRSVLSTVSAPALVIHPTDDIACPIDNGRWLADHIPGAQFVEIPGEHVTAVVTQRFMDETEGFLTGNHRGVITDRLLATVMFSDIVGSTTRAVSLGDRRWRELLDQHDVIVERLVDTHRGKVVKNVGDGMLATFDGPARAVSCGSAIHAELQPLDINVRVGLHTGEIETRGTDVSGIAVHIGERVASLARPGEVLVSRTVVDLVAGSGLSFDDRGEHELKGVPGTWRLFAVAS